MRNSKITKTRKLFEEDCRVFCINEKFYQERAKKGLTELKPFISTAKHKYGKDLSYELINVYNFNLHKYMLVSYHSFLYAWYKGEVPVGYDVDHIDGDTLNNDLSNLQLLTREENLAKRGGGNRNQYGESHKIYCIELDKEFSGIYEAAKELGIDYALISVSLKHHQPKKLKYHFKYVDETLANKYQTRELRKIYCKELDKTFFTILEASKELDISAYYINETLKGNNPKKAKYHFEYVA